MASDETTNRQDNFPKSDFPPVPGNERDKEIRNEQEDAIPQSQGSDNSDQQNGNQFPKISETNKENQWTLANKISLASAILSFLGIIGTVFALYYTYLSVKTSNESLTLTKQSVEDANNSSKESIDLTNKSLEATNKLARASEINASYNDSFFNLSKISMTVSDSISHISLTQAKRNLDFWEQYNANSIKASNKTFEFQSSMLKGQLQAYENEKEYYSKSNDGYLDVSAFAVDTLTNNNPVTWKYLLKNMGHNVIREEYAGSILRIIPVEEYESFIADPINYVGYIKLKKTVKYMSSDAPTEVFGFTYEPLNQGQIDSIRDKKLVVFLGGTVIFRNTYNNKQRVFTYFVEIIPITSKYPFPNKTFNIIFDKNEDVKNQK